MGYVQNQLQVLSRHKYRGHLSRIPFVAICHEACVENGNLHSNPDETLREQITSINTAVGIIGRGVSRVRYLIYKRKADSR